MARRIINGGYPLIIHTRAKEKPESLINIGAIWKNSVKELAQDAHIVITIVGYPQDVEDVSFGDQGILENIKENTYVVDMTTSKPGLARKIDIIAKSKNEYTCL